MLNKIDITKTLEQLYAKNLNEWHRAFDINTEEVRYILPEEHRAKRAINRIDYTGFRRNGYYFSCSNDRLEFCFTLRDEKAQKELEAIFLQDENFACSIKSSDELSKIGTEFSQSNNKKVGYIHYGAMPATQKDPYRQVVICLPEKPDNPDYLDTFFATVAKLETIPENIKNDIKWVIGVNCVKLFKRKIDEFKSYENLVIEYLKSGVTWIRPCAIQGAPSSAYLAAQYCASQGFYRAMMLLIRQIPVSHWQYEEAHKYMLQMAPMKDLIWYMKQADQNQAAKTAISSASAASAVSSTTPNAASNKPSSAAISFSNGHQLKTNSGKDSKERSDQTSIMSLSPLIANDA